MFKAKRMIFVVLFISFFLSIFLFQIQINAVESDYNEYDEKYSELNETKYYSENRINVKIRNTLTVKEYASRQSNNNFSEYGILEMKAITIENKIRKCEVPDEEIWYSAKIKKGLDPLEVIDALEEDSRVIVAEPDYIMQISEDIMPCGTTDPRINEQWYLEKAGILEAWEYLKAEGIKPGGNRDIVVAVIDTGVDYNHVDLKDNMWINKEETNNNFDSDYNGFVDDIYGVDFITGSNNPMDDEGHGTSVSGIIAAIVGNNEGIAGVSFNTKIMALKAGNSSGEFYSSDVLAAIYYAVDKGADVINMSFGSYRKSVLQEEALKIASENSVLVAAAGNDAVCNCGYESQPLYPASYNWVIGVMASNKTGELAQFSNWDYIPFDNYEYELIAPGVNILSTIPDDKYDEKNGTSLATPIVSGIAALVRSVYPDKKLYSSEFIMGQVISSRKVFNDLYSGIDACKAVSKTPNLMLNYLEHYIFDETDVSRYNNADNIVDAGETIKLGIVVKNLWGIADDVTVKLEIKEDVGENEQFVKVLNDTVKYGLIDTFQTKSNGLIKEDGEITGVEEPFIIKINKDTPNEYTIPLRLVITAKNVLDANDAEIYEYISDFELDVVGKDASCFFYDVDSDAKTITKYYPKGKENDLPEILDVVIPSQINGVDITSIGSSAFSGNNLTSVEIPNCVVNIGDSAFRDNNLTSVKIPNSVTSVGKNAFLGVGHNNITWEGKTEEDFWEVYCGTLKGSIGLARDLVIPSEIKGAKITSIGDDAFSSNNLISVEIPDSITNIGSYAFSNNDMKSVTIPVGVKKIGSFAYSNISCLSSVYFKGDAPSEFGYCVFQSCETDFSIYFHEGKEGFTTPTWNGYNAIMKEKLVECNIESKMAIAGSDIEMNIMIPANTMIAGATFEVGYDANIIELLSVHEGDVFKDGNVDISILEDKIIVDYVGMEEITEEGSILKLKFRIPKDTQEQIVPVVLDVIKLFRANYNEIGYEIEQGAISIKDCLLGDINNDGGITTIDALMVLQSVSGRIEFTQQQNMPADVNKDGKVSTIDALIILQHASGRINSFN